MLAAFLLGLTGSLGHCAGMCSGIALLLTRRRVPGYSHLLWLHLGRITTYAMLGAAAGAFGDALLHGAGPAMAGMNQTAGLALAPLQGLFALTAGLMAVYMAAALLGKVPPPDRLLGGFSRRWGRRVRGFNSQPAGSLRLFGLGLWWGLLPCGLVLAALLTAGATANPGAGALAMFLFGLGTWPVPMLVSLLGRTPAGARLSARPRLRYLSATIMLLFGLQLGLRGLAAWQIISHLHLGEVMLW